MTAAAVVHRVGREASAGELARGLRLVAEGIRVIAASLEAAEAGPELPATLSVAELAQLARQHPDTVRAACATGKVPGAFHSGRHGRWRIPRAGAEAYLAGARHPLEIPASPVRLARGKPGAGPDFVRQLQERRP